MNTKNNNAPLTGFDPNILVERGYLPAPGNCLLVLDSAQEQVLGRCAVWPFSVLDMDGKNPFRSITLIAPPRMVWDFDDTAVLEMIRQGLTAVNGRALSDSYFAAVRQRVKIARCPTIEADCLRQEVERCGEAQFIMIPSITLFRDRTITPPVSRSHGIMVEEDRWVRHTAAIATALSAMAFEKGHFILLTSVAEAPMKAVNHQALLDIEGMAVVGMRERPADHLVSSIERWIALALSGKVRQALTELEAEDLAEFTKRQAKMQILVAAGEAEEAAHLIHELSPDMQFSEVTVVKWAKVCADGGRPETARHLLDGWIGKLLQKEILEQALQVATQLRESRLLVRVWERLSQLFPESEALPHNCEFRLVQYCQSGIMTTQIGFPEHLAFLASSLLPTNAVDYEALLAELESRYPEHKELGRLGSALHAEARGEGPEAVVLAADLIGESRFSPNAAGILLRTMRKLLLAEELDADDSSIFHVLLIKLVEHLAQRPHDAVFRNAVVNTFSVESAGRLGLGVLASVCFHFAQTPPEAAAKQTPVQPADPAAFTAFLSRLRGWMGNDNVLDPRVTPPPDLFGANPLELEQSVYLALQRELPECKTEADLEGNEFLVHVLTLLSRQAPSGHDIDGLRLFAARYSLLGNHQRARDLAEQILVVAGPSPVRRRLAWSAYADVYLRTRSYPGALLGLSCALSIDALLPASILFQEWYIALRLARELRMTKEVDGLLATCRRFAEKHGLTPTMRHRLDGIALGLKVSVAPRENVKILEDLLRECELHLRQALELQDELILSAFQFGQVAGFIERAGGAITPELGALREEVLGLLGDETAAFLRTVSAVRPSADQLVALHNRMSDTRNAEDAPTDLEPVGMSARRLLAASDPEVLPESAFVAIELLAERGIQLPSAVPRLQTNWPLQFAQDLVAKEELAILMLGIDDAGELVAAIADKSGAYVVRPRPAARSMRDRLRTWLTKYPFRYGLIEDAEGDREFYTTMAEIPVPLPASRRVLVVAQPELAQLTFNLILDSRGELAGYSAAVGLVPSLTWFSAVRTRSAGGDGRRVAWLSHRDADQLDALTVVKGMLEPTLDKYGVALDTSSKLPENLRGAQLAIVTAHGQLTTEQKFIHRIVDEDDLIESPASLVRAFGGVELVILFVCSGGRVDKHPISNTTVGLPKMLLDNGSRAVIASPWPLNSLVPGRWLPLFLEQWQNGASILDACFIANSELASRPEREPQGSLAMVVYGDPLLRQASPL